MSANSPSVLRVPWLKAAVLLVAVPLLGIVRAGNTTCISKQLDWYLDEVGESPCMTYQRLRQICNPDYQVTSFRSTSPGDQCDEVVSSCCCNSIAYTLSMLCMNCLYDVDETNGIDAAPGGYSQYLGSCGPGTNQNLPIDAQTSVCNEDIKISITFYNLFWTDGSWLYGATKDYAHKDQVSTKNDTFTRCPNQRRVPESVTPSPSSSTTSASSVPPPPSSSKTSASSVPPPDTGVSKSGSTSVEASSASISTSTGDTTPAGQGHSGSKDTGVSKSGSTSASASISTSTGDTMPAGQGHSGSNIGPVVGAVVGGVGAVLLLSMAAIILWRIRRRRAPSTSYRPGTDSLALGDPSDASVTSITPFAQVANTAGPAASPETTGAVPMLERATTPITLDRSRPSPPVSRHEDGGPIFELVRSPSGRLPPAYHSWVHEGESTAPGIRVLVDSQVSDLETQSNSQSVTGARPLASSPLDGKDQGALSDDDSSG